MSDILGPLDSALTQINSAKSVIATVATPSSNSFGPVSSAGYDNTLSERVIGEVGEQDDGEGVLDRVEVYEHEFFEYGDSVSSIDLSAIPGDAELNFLGYDANGAMIIAIGDDGVIVTLEGSAAAYLAQFNYNGEAGPLGVSVDALIGASVDGEASFNINPMEGDFELSLQAGVVVGATVNANGTLELGHVTLEAGATGIAGLAADVNLDVGFDDWEFEFDAGAKLAVLIGGGADISFSVDGKAIVADLGEMGEVVWDEAGNIVGGAVDFGEGVIEFGGDIVDWVGDTAGDVHDAVKGDGVPYIPGV